MINLKKTINIIEGGFNIESPFYCQFFFIYPRFHLLDGSHGQTKLHYFLNNRYEGDFFKKLNFKGVDEYKYLNGFVISVLYERLDGWPADDYICKHKITLEFPEEAGCWCCEFNDKGKCELWENEIYGERYSCELWEER